MKREIALKVLLGLIGLGFLWCIYPLVGALVAGPKSDIIPQDQMILGIYVPIGVYVLMAIRNPAENRSLILCIVWSTLAHDGVMVVQGLRAHTLREDAPGYGVIAVVFILLGILAPRKKNEPRDAAARSTSA